MEPSTAAKSALRSVACRIATLTAEVAELTAQVKQLVILAAPITLQQLGLGAHNTAALLIAAGENIGRFSSEPVFAHLCGVAPVPASSGRITRHRHPCHSHLTPIGMPRGDSLVP
jgi:transposase